MRLKKPPTKETESASGVRWIVRDGKPVGAGRTVPVSKPPEEIEKKRSIGTFREADRTPLRTRRKKPYER